MDSCGRGERGVGPGNGEFGVWGLGFGWRVGDGIDEIDYSVIEVGDKMGYYGS